MRAIAVVELDDQLPSVGLGLFWHRDRVLTPAAEAFGEFVRERCVIGHAALAAQRWPLAVHITLTTPNLASRA